MTDKAKESTTRKNQDVDPLSSIMYTYAKYMSVSCLMVAQNPERRKRDLTPALAIHKLGRFLALIFAGERIR